MKFGSSHFHSQMLWIHLCVGLPSVIVNFSHLSVLVLLSSYGDCGPFSSLIHLCPSYLLHCVFSTFSCGVFSVNPCVVFWVISLIVVLYRCIYGPGELRVLFLCHFPNFQSPDNPCFLMGMIRLFRFSVLINMLWFKSILLLIFYF